MPPTGRILVVEREKALANSWRALLESRGYQVRIAYDGLSALAAVRADSFDLMVVDLQCDGLGGVEIVASLRRTGGAARAPMIAVAGPSEIGDRLQLFELGVDDIVARSVTPLELLSRVRRVLSSTAPSQPAPSRVGRVAVFVGSAGGVGTTTLCANVAQALGSRMSTVLLDFAWPLGGVSDLLSMPPRPGLLQATSAPDGAGALSASLTGGPPSLNFRLLAGRDGLPSLSEPQTPVLDVLHEAQALAACVLVDLGHAAAPFASQVAAEADCVVLVSALERTHLIHARTFLRWLDALGIDQAKRIIVGNRLRPSPLGHREAQRCLEEDVFLIVPNESDRLSECLNEGRLLVSQSPSSPGAVAVVELASALVHETPTPSSRPVRTALA